MNPWYSTLRQEQGEEHDHKCMDGKKCSTRESHINGTYMVRALRRMVERQSAQLHRVRELHKPSTDHGEGYDPYCVGCWEAGGMDAAPLHPCPTIRALDGD